MIHRTGNNDLLFHHNKKIVTFSILWIIVNSCGSVYRASKDPLTRCRLSISLSRDMLPFRERVLQQVLMHLFRYCPHKGLGVATDRGLKLLMLHFKRLLHIERDHTATNSSPAGTGSMLAPNMAFWTSILLVFCLHLAVVLSSWKRERILQDSTDKDKKDIEALRRQINISVSTFRIVSSCVEEVVKNYGNYYQ